MSIHGGRADIKIQQWSAMLYAQRIPLQTYIYKFKMASVLYHMSAEEVLSEFLAETSGETSDSEDNDSANNNANLATTINRCLEALDSLDLGTNTAGFKKCVEKFIETSFFAFQPPSDPMKILLNRTVNCATIFNAESKQWLKKISNRLSGKISIRHPYQGEIVRNFPSEMFFALKTSVQHSRKEEITNNVFYNDNKNRNVMSFSSRKAVIVFLSLLSGYSETNVKGFFKKILAGRTHGKARVIVSCSKEFSFTYNIKTGQFCVSFHYGVWNKAGFPLHNF